MTPEQLGLLITRIDDDTLSSKTAKELFKALWASADIDASVDVLIEQLGLKQMSDDGELTAIVVQVLADNPNQWQNLSPAKIGAGLNSRPGYECHGRQGQSKTGQRADFAQPVSLGYKPSGRGSPPLHQYIAARYQPTNLPSCTTG